MKQLKPILTVVNKEVRDFFISPIAYITLTVFLIATGLVFNLNLFIESQANLRKLFEVLPVILIILTSAVTMRSWAEERREGNLEVLLAQPISTLGLLVSKTLSSLVFCLIAILGTLPIVIALLILGHPDLGVILASYLSLILLALVYILMGQAISINTENQIVAFIGTAAVLTVLYIMGESELLKFMPQASRNLLEVLSTSSHYRNLIKGVVDTRDLLYFISLKTFLVSIIYLSLQRLRLQGK